MPNHCTNSVSIEGEFSHRQEFVDKNKGFDWTDTDKKREYRELSFHAQVPIPKKHIVSHAKDGSNSDWYGWCNSNWGTKWDCYEIEVSHSESFTSYSFDTAWGSPTEWIKKVSKKFPHLRFHVEWAEEGGHGGRYSCWNGEFFHDELMNHSEWKDFMGYTDDDEDW